MPCEILSKILFNRKERKGRKEPIHHEGPNAAEPQPKFGKSLAKAQRR
jgi:hypothetical protein